MDKLTFRLGDNYYAIETARVYGIIESKDIYFLPGRLGFVKGVISLRGETVAVLDGSVLSGRSSGKTNTPGKIVVIKEENRFLGIDISDAEIFFKWGDNRAARDMDEQVATEAPPADLVEVPCETIFNLAEKILAPGRKKVLIADDMEFYRSSQREILCSGGFKVMAEACNGQEAVDLTKKFQPEIVILDIVMPKKNGIDAAIEIKALPSAPRVIICSSLGDETIVDDAMRAGVDAYIKKPYTSTEFLHTVLDTA
ncbi:MAG: response regulator [Thermodesulfobacteriota bacterium]